jgi:hypothetical protein
MAKQFRAWLNLIFVEHSNLYLNHILQEQR